MSAKTQIVMELICPSESCKRCEVHFLWCKGKMIRLIIQSGFCFFCREDLDDPHAAAMWDSDLIVSASIVERT